MTLVIDAEPMLALGEARHPLHTAILDTLQGEVGELILPAPVSAEVDHLIGRRGGIEARRRFLEDLALGRFRVEGLTPEEHAMALTIHYRYPDLGLGMADLSVVVLAHRFRTNRLLTFDERHFGAIEPIDGGAFTLLPAGAETRG